MIKVFVTSVFWLISLNLFSQTVTIPSIEWQRCYGGSQNDKGYCISRTADDGFIFAGCSGSLDGDVLPLTDEGDLRHGSKCDYWFVKINATGDTIFKWNPGGTGSDVAGSAIQTSDGGYLIGGGSESNDVDVTGNHGSFDFWVLKLDANGQEQWQHCYGGTLYEDYGSLAEVPGSGFVFCGGTGSNNGDVSGNHGSSDFLLIKTDNGGAFQWSKCYGGSGYEKAFDVKPCSDGGYILAGFTDSQNGDVTGLHGVNQDGWLVKADAAGNIQWEKCFGGMRQDEFFRVIQLPNGNFVATGSTNSSDGDISFLHGDTSSYNPPDDAWVIMTDANGNLKWSKTFGGSNDDEFRSLLCDALNNIDVVGFTFSNDGDLVMNYGDADYWIAGVDTNGALMWSKTFGGAGTDICYDVAATQEGGLMVNGYTASGCRCDSALAKCTDTCLNGSSPQPDHDVYALHDSLSTQYTDYWVVKFGTVVGISKTISAQLKIFPTLAHDKIRVSGSGFNEGSSELRIISSDGKEMMRKPFTKQQQEVLNVSSLPQGMYFVEVINTKANALGKFVKY